MNLTTKSYLLFLISFGIGSAFGWLLRDVTILPPDMNFLSYYNSLYIEKQGSKYIVFAENTNYFKLVDTEQQALQVICELSSRDAFISNETKFPFGQTMQDTVYLYDFDSQKDTTFIYPMPVFTF